MTELKEGRCCHKEFIVFILFEIAGREHTRERHKGGFKQSINQNIIIKVLFLTALEILCISFLEFKTTYCKLDGILKYL